MKYYVRLVELVWDGALDDGKQCTNVLHK